MLVIKTVLAYREEIATLIFDEIDTGISGITAGKVAEKMGMLAKEYQVICITHLAQIAAMADAHYVIEKTVQDGVTKTAINELTEEESVAELSRLLGGSAVTESIRQSAVELKKWQNFPKENQSESDKTPYTKADMKVSVLFFSKGRFWNLAEEKIYCEECAVVQSFYVGRNEV